MSRDSRRAPRGPRPVAVTWLALAGLFFSAFYLGRLAFNLQPSPFPLSVPSWYLPATGAIWGFMGLALSVGLWRGSTKAFRLAYWTVPGYLLWYWIDRLVLQRSDFAQVSYPAALLVSASFLVAVYGVLTRPSVRAYFRESPDE